MKPLAFVATALTLGLSFSLTWAAEMSVASKDLVNPMMRSQQTQPPPQEWTELKGTVKAVDLAAKLVNIDAGGSLIQIPVNKYVTINKDGKKTDLTQLQPGDVVVLAKGNATYQ